MKKGIAKFTNYILHMLEGNDNKLSGKRVLGTALIVMGMIIGIHSVWICSDNTGNDTMMVGAFFGAGLAFWGITTWSSVKEMQMNSSTDISKTVASDSSTSTIQVTKTVATNPAISDTPPANSGLQS